MKSTSAIRILSLCCSFVGVLLLLAICAASTDAKDAPPNILVVLADDLGYGDLGCYGHPQIKTPNIDRFAAESLRLTSCYSAHPNCSPARAGLMTGRTPFRVGIYNWIPMYSPMHVKQSEITIATLLRDAGYDTCHVGKWHLNGDFNLPSQPQPSDHGFNHWFSTQNNALPNHRNPDNFVRNGEAVGPLEGYSAQLVAAEAGKWLRDLRDQEKPFFLFACFHEPHEPIASDKKFTDLYESDDPSLPAHHGNVSQLDAGFGSILADLDALGLRKSTVIFFTSDNGPAITGMHPHGSAGPLRDKKGAIYEGGIRVPGILHWPGTESGVSDEPVSGVDVLPTLCAVAGIKPPSDRILDGTSFLPILNGEKLNRSKPLYWQFNRAKSKAKVAIRSGQWKLVASLNTPDPKPSGGIPDDEMKNIKSAELIDFELFDLSKDIAESEDVSDQRPLVLVLATLISDMLAIYREVRDAAPQWPAWEWAKYESKRIQWPEYWLEKRKRAAQK